MQVYVTSKANICTAIEAASVLVQGRTDTSEITNPQKDPQQFSNNQGLGGALTSQAKDGSENGQGLPSPLDTAPDPATTGSKGPGLNLNPFK